MSAEIFNIRDFQTKRDIERMKAVGLDLIYQASATEFSAQLNVWPDFSQANAYHAPDKDAG